MDIYTYNTKLPLCIHQLSVCAKKNGWGETKSTVSNIIIRIKGGHNALTHRQFKVQIKILIIKFLIKDLIS